MSKQDWIAVFQTTLVKYYSSHRVDMDIADTCTLSSRYIASIAKSLCTEGVTYKNYRPSPQNQQGPVLIFPLELIQMVEHEVQQMLIAGIKNQSSLIGEIQTNEGNNG